MGIAIDLTGQRFGRLMVTGRDTNKTEGGSVWWKCRCDCGRVKTTIGQSLRKGATRSCGCLHAEHLLTKPRLSHGRTNTAEYRAWTDMKTRCFNQKNRCWNLYGGRGITVCAEWLNDFPAFFAHVGCKPTPEHTLDRIDGQRNYEPGNVRWATLSEQNKNRRPFRVGKPRESASA